MFQISEASGLLYLIALFLVLVPSAPLSDSHEHGIHTLPLHLHHPHELARARLGHHQEVEAPPGGPGRLREGGEDWGGGDSAL